MYSLFDMFMNRWCNIKIKIVYKLYKFIKNCYIYRNLLFFPSRISEDHARQLEWRFRWRWALSLPIQCYCWCYQLSLSFLPLWHYGWDKDHCRSTFSYVVVKYSSCVVMICLICLLLFLFLLLLLLLYNIWCGWDRAVFYRGSHFSCDTTEIIKVPILSGVNWAIKNLLS